MELKESRFVVPSKIVLIYNGSIYMTTELDRNIMYRPGIFSKEYNNGAYWVNTRYISYMKYSEDELYLHLPSAQIQSTGVNLILVDTRRKVERMVNEELNMIVHNSWGDVIKGEDDIYINSDMVASIKDNVVYGGLFNGAGIKVAGDIPNNFLDLGVKYINPRALSSISLDNHKENITGTKYVRDSSTSLMSAPFTKEIKSILIKYGFVEAKHMEVDKYAAATSYDKVNVPVKYINMNYVTAYRCRDNGLIGIYTADHKGGYIYLLNPEYNGVVFRGPIKHCSVVSTYNLKDEIYIATENIMYIDTQSEMATVNVGMPGYRSSIDVKMTEDFKDFLRRNIDEGKFLLY